MIGLKIRDPVLSDHQVRLTFLRFTHSSAQKAHTLSPKTWALCCKDIRTENLPYLWVRSAFPGLLLRSRIHLNEFKLDTIHKANKIAPSFSRNVRTAGFQILPTVTSFSESIH